MLRARYLLIVVFLAAASQASGQFLRLGPLEFEANTGVQAIYTTNVENERESEAVGEMEDVYFVWYLDLTTQAYVFPNTDLLIDSGIAVERHLNREDLDNTSRPFARASVDTQTEISRYTLNLFASYNRTAESQEDVFIPGESSLRRRDRTVKAYGGSMLWDLDPFSLNAGYDFSSERYDEERDQGGDKDETSWNVGIEWKINQRIATGYNYLETKTDNINSGVEAPWEVTQDIYMRFDILERPALSYTFGYQREDKGADKGEWEYTHTISVEDSYQIADNLTLDYSINYQTEETPEDDDITLTYGAGLEHIISRTARQGLTAERKPVDTFGATTDTDNTTITYDFKKFDLLIFDLDFDFNVSYQINDPVEGPTENIWNYTTGLRHSVPVSRQMERSLEYRYTREDSNLNPEILEEHRVTLTYDYTF